jgi:hypothetical protein
MKKVLFFFLLITSFSMPQTAGNTGLSFLKIGFGARNIAMGDIGVVSASDVTSLFYNPARLSEMTSSEIIFMHNEWIQDSRSEVLGASFRLWGIPLAVGVNTTSVSGFEARLLPGEPLSTFDMNYFGSSLSTGLNLFENLSIGFTGKYLYEGTFSDEAMGWGIDLSAFYSAPIDGLSIGAVVRNIGKMDKLRNESTKLPTELRIGGLYSFDYPIIKSEISIGSEFQKYIDTDDAHINFGGEILYDNILAFRLGYQTNYESKGFASGLGLKWGRLNFDYAFTPFSYNLGSAHIISIKFRF